jgi:hypothetical protein
MDETWRTFLWQQFGAAIDTLDNAMLACPDELWDDGSYWSAFWYSAYHALYFVDLYSSGPDVNFAPPAPFTNDEPERVYSKEELRTYLRYCRGKSRAAIESLTDETIRRQCLYPWGMMEFGELWLYNLRHVQHHAAQLNLILRQRADLASRWVFRARP